MTVSCSFSKSIICLSATRATSYARCPAFQAASKSSNVFTSPPVSRLAVPTNRSTPSANMSSLSNAPDSQGNLSASEPNPAPNPAPAAIPPGPPGIPAIPPIAAPALLGDENIPYKARCVQGNASHSACVNPPVV